MRPYLMIAAAMLLGACSQETAAPAEPVLPAVVDTPAPSETVSPATETLPASPAAPVEIALAPAPQAPASPAPSQPVQQPAAAQRDARMVGIWVNEDIINSGGANFASYTTVMTMELHPDGRVIQYTESIGGGGDWSYDGGRTIDFDGQWRADGQTLFVYAAPLPDFTPAATYSFSGEYLVTQSDMGRLIWQRRG
ncbi:hypothetical protein [Hyphomonas sp.]|uniref:hypothetical protein n=1 Tax=Hyphomonas sp. TaxID=87 RepID=UPI0025BB9D14|nr:hypothetical protein [Hyphomonas sp.]